MGDDDLLDELAKLARERRKKVDPRWDALARGELSEAERAELLAAETDDELPQMFEPLGEEFADRMAERLARPAAPLAPPSAEIVRPTFGRRRWALLAVPVLALAAALLLYVATPVAEPLPSYGIEITGGDRTVRGGAPSDGPVRLSPGSRVEIVGRPDTAVPSPVGAEVVVHTSAGDRPWTGTMDVSATGAVRLAGTLGQDVALPPGPAEVEIRVHLRDNVADGAHVLKVPIVVTE